MEKSNNLSDLTSAATSRNNLLPTQVSQSGKVLGTDGTNVSWVSPSGSPLATNIVQGITALTVAAVDPLLPKAVGDNDGRMPTQAMRDALAGTGTPSGSNKFVTADTDALKELLTNKSTTTTLGTSDTLYPTQNAVKTYVDNNAGQKVTVVTSDATYTNTDTNEQTWISVSIPGNTLGTSNAIRLRGYFVFTAGSTTATLEIKLKYGATTVYDSGALAQTSSAVNKTGYLEIILIAAGATNSQAGYIILHADSNGTINPDVVTFFHIQGKGTSAIDSTSAQNLIVTAQSGTGNSANVLTLSDYVVEKIR